MKQIILKVHSTNVCFLSNSANPTPPHPVTWQYYSLLIPNAPIDKQELLSEQLEGFLAFAVNAIAKSITGQWIIRSQRVLVLKLINCRLTPC